MAFPIPSVGDILMLSHLCWKIGCAFTAGRNGAPAEFLEVEAELKGLRMAITMLADTLETEDSILIRCDSHTQKGMATIIGCCSQSLENLDAFVEQYQDIKRSNEGGGMSVQGSWRKVLLRNWRTIAWTTEGEGIQSLRNMLAMHTQSIQLAMTALQSQSLARIENTIEPMAAKMDKIHSRLHGDLDRKIEEIHTVMLALREGQVPTDWSRSRSPELARYSPSMYPPSYHTNTPGTTPGPRPQSYSERDDLSQLERPAASPIGIRTPDLSDSDVAYSPPRQFNARTGSSSQRDSSPQLPFRRPSDSYHQMEQNQPLNGSIERQPSLQSYASSSGLGISPSSRPIHRIDSRLDRPSLTLPPPALDSNDNYMGGTSYRQSSNGSPSAEGQTRISRSSSVSNGRLTPLTPLSPSRMSSIRSDSRPISPHHRRPSSAANGLPTVADYNEEENDDSQQRLSLADSVKIADAAPARPSDIGVQKIATVEEQLMFEKGLVSNVMVMCEVAASTVDYTVPNEENTGDFVLQNACEECKVYLITRGTKIQSGKTRYLTSVWVISNDRKVRLQIPLPEDTSIIPYTIWNSPCKPVIRDPVTLRFHDTSLDDKPISVVKTSWVKFTFADELTSTTFQNALMDNKSILLSVCTKRTMRIFEGITSPFQFAEQMCGLENLRMVYDPATGLVNAMLHYTTSFSAGWMIFALNRSGAKGGDVIRVREEDERTIRIKGLRIPVGERDKKTGGRRPSEPDELEGDREARRKRKQEWVAGAKIEFSTPLDKKEFMQKLKEIQEGPAARV